MEASNKQKRRWLVEFGLVSLIPIVLLGLFLGQAINSNARSSATSAARDRARSVGELAFGRALSQNAGLSRGLSDAQQSSLDRSFASLRVGSDIARVILRNRGGAVVYSDDRTILSGSSPPPAEAREAIDGSTVSKVTDVGGDPSSSDARLGRVLQIFAPP